MGGWGVKGEVGGQGVEERKIIPQRGRQDQWTWEQIQFLSANQRKANANHKISYFWFLGLAVENEWQDLL